MTPSGKALFVSVCVNGGQQILLIGGSLEEVGTQALANSSGFNDIIKKNPINNPNQFDVCFFANKEFLLLNNFIITK